MKTYTVTEQELQKIFSVVAKPIAESLEIIDMLRSLKPKEGEVDAEETQ